MNISKTTLAIVCIAMIAFIVLTCHYSSRPIQESSEQVDTLVWVNNAGDITKSIAADPSYFSRVRQEIIDSMAKAYKTSPKKIIEYVVIHEQGESDIPQTGNTEADYFDTAKKDCPPQIKSLAGGFKNDYYTVNVKLSLDGDSSSMHISSRDTLTMLWKWINEGNILHRTKRLQLDVSNANPDNKVYIDQAYRIYEKPKKWGVGAQAGVGFFGSMKPTPYLGIGISYSLINF